jgi:hypothetical protein
VSRTHGVLSRRDGLARGGRPGTGTFVRPRKLAGVDPVLPVPDAREIPQSELHRVALKMLGDTIAGLEKCLSGLPELFPLTQPDQG